MRHCYCVGEHQWEQLTRSVILPSLYDALKCKEVLQELITDVPAHIRQRIWFEKDGAPSHYRRCVRNHLVRVFPNKLISRCFIFLFVKKKVL